MVSTQKVLGALALSSVAICGEAPISTDSPDDFKYVATFEPAGNYDVTGTVSFSAAQNGSVLVSVDLSGLPSTGGPFPYHVHEHPVPTDGNCTGTLAHLNPFGGSVNATDAAGKEVGDLAGKHGNIEGQSADLSYVDDYLSLNPDNKAYIGGLSVVVHLLDNTRIACANITREPVTSADANVTNTTSVEAQNAAGSNMVAVGLTGMVAAAVCLLV
ncbi:Cu/Zn superoxide dismutase [Scheffersomyces stipitis CBS 6054]|uniref:superoxide dismutase n=1 Tax=Scheffersomyces stipitis (strain ATCC 58785 / CBS 6054 / NBRC 10063 / NRRL Y-11545) TaxID=322104 RepID=A3LMU2_PICST|nr:Cu/Zn superoxide dismutase [Scheffersomyces stipitis CBS 6054]ABN64745.2 Cu/Zn superoxide dismutase [Scheffersomyces stipitis CBS 6054]KAG2736907.1 hypothetical protein G9P44_000997 [Scheffersomyces stipitis]